ncbi:TolB family protein [Confluentibacter lentus]|uniref:TolB family protein n=1 Tax=Confluentibacter lentus TaxID=1699412 RepID=UPI000C28E8D8|nr:PD40 domain-containing protein [Confluentibacter lentus]
MKRLIPIMCFMNMLMGFSQESKKAFIPDIVKQFPNVRDIAISPDGNEMLFSAQSIMGNLSSVITIKKENGIWNKPQVTSFSGQYFDLEPFFSPDGLKIYFVSNRPIHKASTTIKDFDIWYVERDDLNKNWSEPKNLGSPINTLYDEFYPSIATNGNLYFTRDNTSLKNKDDIYFSEFKDSQYTEPMVLPNAINSEGYEYNAFIASDESFLIYGSYNRSGGFGSGDLYISFNSETGWTPAKNLGEHINSDKMDYCPFVDLKTSTLYFTSKMDNTITEFEKPLTIDELFEELNKYDNGLSRLYHISIETLLKNKVTN